MNYENFQKIINFQKYFNSKVIKSQLKQFGRPFEVWRLKNEDYAVLGGLSGTVEDVQQSYYELIGQRKVLLYSKGLASQYVYNREVTVIYYEDYFKIGDILRSTFNNLTESFVIKEPIQTAQGVVYQFIAVPININNWRN